jgi:polysaccharide export outer membrane protein
MLFYADNRMRNYGLIFFLACFFGCALMANAVNERKSQEYIINYGDQLIITIVGHEKDLTAPVTVRPDGKITYDMVGELDAAGLTIFQLSDNIRKKLIELGYFIDPLVTVQFRGSSLVTIYIIGDVQEPGQKAFAEPISIIEALASVGGFRESADLANAMIIRRQKDVIPINLEFLKSNPKTLESIIREIPDNNFMLKNGDVLSIPSSVKEQRINVIGHVRKPGIFRATSNINIIEALALAEGALTDTADLKRIMIVSDDGIKIIDAMQISNNNTAQSSSDNLAYTRSIQPGDSVIVPERGKFSVLGTVEKQGRYAIADKITLIEALSLSGLKDAADLKKIKIVRATGEERTVNISKLWEQPDTCKEFVDSGDIIIVPAKRYMINWNAVSAVVMVFSTLYAVFRN